MGLFGWVFNGFLDGFTLQKPNGFFGVSALSVSTSTLFETVIVAGSPPRAKSQKSRFAALAETINSWEDEVTPPMAK